MSVLSVTGFNAVRRVWNRHRFSGVETEKSDADFIRVDIEDRREANRARCGIHVLTSVV